MSDELKPCPFCGGPAEMFHGGPGCCFVRCESCHASSDDCAEDRSRALWNRRAEQTPTQTGTAEENISGFIRRVQILKDICNQDDK